MQKRAKLFFITSNGCIRRKKDAQRVLEYLSSNGYEQTDDPCRADFLILISCAYDKPSEDVSTFAIKRMKEMKNRSAKIFVGGCLPSIHPGVIQISPEVEIVCEPRRMQEIEQVFPPESVGFADIQEPVLVDRNLTGEQGLCLRETRVRFMSERISEDESGPDWSYHQFKKQSCIICIAQGCLSSCSFCSIRSATGILASKPIEIVQEECQRALKRRVHKITLTGEDTGAFGKDIGSTIVELLDRVAVVDASLRFALTSVNPKWVIPLMDEFSSVFARRDVFRHAVLPMQSASDNLLKAMRRDYSVAEVAGLFEQLRETACNLQIHTHVIVGFPGETLKDIERLITFCGHFPEVNFKVFKFSERPGIRANTLSKPVSCGEVEIRYNLVMEELREQGLFRKSSI